MRASLLVLAALCSCAAPASESPEGASALADLLRSDSSSLREEGIARLGLLGLALGELPGLTEKALVRIEEDTDSLGAGLEAALGERDPERIVWRAWHRLRLGCLSREDRRVTDALAREGLRPVEIYEPDERSRFVRYVARKAAWVNAAGDRHDLFFWIQSATRDDGGWRVREVYAGLHVAFNAPFRTLTPAERYPRESMLGRFFDLPEVRKVAAVFPQLEEIELTYGRIRERDAESAPAGFHVNAGFRLAGEGKNGGRGIYCTAESGLDPRETRRGRLLREGFAPRDAIGPLVLRGSSVWGAGGFKPTDD